jgi:hypothetical protein
MRQKCFIQFFQFESHIGWLSLVRRVDAAVCLEHSQSKWHSFPAGGQSSKASNQCGASCNNQQKGVGACPKPYCEMTTACEVNKELPLSARKTDLELSLKPFQW